MSVIHERCSVLLLHGLCSTPDELLPLQGALRKQGVRVLPLQLPGYSFEAARTRQLASPWRQWVHAVADEASLQHRHGQTVVLAGISAGATLALAAAMQAASPIAGLVLMSTPLKYDGWSIPRYHRLMPLALYTPLGRFWRYRERPPYGVKNERVRRWIERELQARRVSCAGAAVIDVPHLREHDRLRRWVRRSLATFACPPVLALHAQDDEVASPANVALLESRLRTPSFRKVLLPDSHHMITIDNDRQQVVDETLQFVGRLAPPAALETPRSYGAPPHDLAHL